MKYTLTVRVEPILFQTISSIPPGKFCNEEQNFLKVYFQLKKKIQQADLSEVQLQDGFLE